MRVVIVDDEPLALRRLRTMLGHHPHVDVVAECDDPAVALDAIRREKPDVLFLDVQMPEVDGFQLLDALDVTPMPFVVFVTAHAEHAARAFDADAVDYILKPYDDARLARSLDRAQAAILRAAQRTGAAGDARARREPATYVTRLTASVGRETYFVKAEDIDWIRADRNYLQLHVGPRQYLVRSSIQGIEEQLDPKRFIRVHRSIIVNVDRIQKLRMVGPGEHRIVLQSGVELPVSARYRERLRGR